jgi:hypothetical protein
MTTAATARTIAPAIRTEALRFKDMPEEGIDRASDFPEVVVLPIGP